MANSEDNVTPLHTRGTAHTWCVSDPMSAASVASCPCYRLAHSSEGEPHFRELEPDRFRAANIGFKRERVR